jgi:cytoskeletal protein RodZ
MKKLLILCILLLAVLLSGCAAEPSQRQSATNTPKASTPQKETSASFEPVSTEPNAPTEAVDPADSMLNEDKHDSSPSFSSEPVSAPTESNAPSSEENEQAPVIPEKPEKIESPKEEASVPAITEPEPTSVPEPTFDIEHWISYAKSTAVSLGLTLDSSATDCWDNPISAEQGCIYLERDINSRLKRYAEDKSITDVWIWYECVGTDKYLIYIGYA